MFFFHNSTKIKFIICCVRFLNSPVRKIYCVQRSHACSSSGVMLPSVHKYRQNFKFNCVVSEKSPKPAIATNVCWWLHFFLLLNFNFNEVNSFLNQGAIFLKMYALNLNLYDIYLNLYDINLKVYDINLILVISFLKFYDIFLNWFKIFFKLVSVFLNRVVGFLKWVVGFLKWVVRNQKHKRIKLIA